MIAGARIDRNDWRPPLRGGDAVIVYRHPDAGREPMRIVILITRDGVDSMECESWLALDPATGRRQVYLINRQKH